MAVTTAREPWLACGVCPFAGRIEPVKILVVEDRGAYGQSLTKEVARVLHSETVRAQLRPSPEPPGVRWVPHDEALAVGTGALAQLSLILLDAWDIGAQQDDRTRSRLTSLDILERIAVIAKPERPRVIVYSSAMDEPEVNIPLRYLGVASGFYRLQAIHDCLPRILTGDLGGQVVPPDSSDWAVLDEDLPGGADVALAHQLMQQRRDAWEQVWNGEASYSRAVQRWIVRNVLPAMNVPSGGGYRLAVSVIRKLAGLPYDPVRAGS